MHRPSLYIDFSCSSSLHTVKFHKCMQGKEVNGKKIPTVHMNLYVLTLFHLPACVPFALKSRQGGNLFHPNWKHNVFSTV